MRYVKTSTCPDDRIVFQPEGSVTYLELEDDAPAGSITKVQTLLYDRARRYNATIRCSSPILTREEGGGRLKSFRIIRVEVVKTGVRSK